MTVRPRFRHTRRALLALAAAVTLALGGLLAGGAGTPSRAATQEPCDIYAAAGTPCVAAHSTTRALYAAYDGPLYQVKRASDGATTNISPLSAGGYANSATQDSFCADTYCTITEIYDQSGHGNNLTDAPAGGAASGPDILANAAAAPTMAGGHKVYGVFISPGMGYRDDSTTDIATGNAVRGRVRGPRRHPPTTAAASTTATPRPTTTTTAPAPWKPSTSATETTWGYRLRQRPVDHGRHGERPVLRLGAGHELRRPDHRLPVHHRDDRGRREPVGHPRRQRATRARCPPTTTGCGPRATTR